MERGEEEPGKHYRSDGHVAHVAGSVSNGGSLGSSFSGSTPSLRRDQFHKPKYWNVFDGVADVSLIDFDADSAFFAAICGGGSECTNAALVELIET